MTGQVLLSAPDVGALEEQYVVAALRSGWVAPAGPDLEAFEREVAARVGVPHAVALSSGTAALHLALLTAGVVPGDLVVVPTLTFAATVNAVVYTGARPVFVDCEPGTGNVDTGLLADLLARLRAERAPVRAVLSVDLLGRCADYDRVLELGERFDVAVVEDAAEALGATYRGRAAGSFGRSAALSFNGNKVMTTSGGGMLLTSDAATAARARYLATQARQPVAHYEHTEVGYNYRLSNLLAALGRAQLCRLDEMITRRRAVRDRYAKLFASVGGVHILGDDNDGNSDGTEGNAWLTAILVAPAEAGWSVGELAGHLAAAGIETRPMWKPMHLQPAFAGARSLLSGEAQRLFETGLVLPGGSALDEAQIARVTDRVRDFLGGSG